MPLPVRTRFAPSPTGFLHLGGARTALFSWLFAKQHNGAFVLRVEDTDKKRNSHDAFQAIYDGLQWLGIDWDEGHEKGGDCGPYNQSQRTDRYDFWFDKLVQKDEVYEENGSWRFRFVREPITVQDLVCGDITIDYRNEEINPDMTIRRSDGSYTFHFVNVVDDIDMEISHVVRGEDHLMNTPKHLQLYRALEVSPPQFAHIPLILNASGKKMSKRDEGASIRDYISQGFLPDAMRNFIALLGWNPKTNQERFSLEELISQFSLTSINRSPAKFDLKKAQWMNQQYLISMPSSAFIAKATAALQHSTLPVEHPSLPTAIAAVQEKVNTLQEIPELIGFLYDDSFTYDSTAVEKVEKNKESLTLLASLKTHWSSLEDWSKAKDQIAVTAKATGSKPGKLMFPTRVALSGKGGGIDLGLLIELLGKEQCLARIDRFLSI